MQRTESPRSKTPDTPPPGPPTLPPSGNGQELSALLGAMQAVKNGDFSVRLPGDWTGLDGKIADTFNEIVTANASMARELERVGTIGRQAGQDPPARPVRLAGRRLGRHGDVGQHPDRRPAVAHDRGDPRARSRGQGRPAPDRPPRRRRAAARRRVPALGDHRQHDDRAARRVHLRGDARRARGRHRRQARRPGRGPQRVGRLEGPHRLASTRWPAT